MSLNDSLANALSTIMTSEKLGKKECFVRPVSSIIGEVLRVMREHGYLGEAQPIKDGKGGIMKVSLLGTINQCNVIKPRHPIQRDTYEKFEKRYLPALNFGILIVSTPKGVMTHAQAKEKGLGGKLLSYCY